MRFTSAFFLVIFSLVSFCAQGTDTTEDTLKVGEPNATQTLVIDVETLTPPKELLTTQPYNQILQGILNDLNEKRSTIIAHTQKTRPLVASNHPFFSAMYMAYAEHRPFELSPDALWLLICQGFSLHVNNNTEELRSMFVNFEGERTLSVNGSGISLNNPRSPWERCFPQFTEQIATYTGQDLINVLAGDFTTSTIDSRVASQITVMESMKLYFDYCITICGIPQIVLHGTPEDWQSIVERVQFLRQYRLDWWVDEMLPVLNKIVLASQGEVDKEFWRGMFKWHDLEHEWCGDPETLADGWIVKFYPYNIHKRRNNLKNLHDGTTELPPELSMVPIKFQDGKGQTTDLTLWAGFVGIGQNNTTFALRPEIGWFITCNK